MERLYKLVDDGISRIDDGIGGVHTRLDLLNGRTLKGEVERENHRTRLVSLEKEVFAAGGPRRRSADHAGDGESWSMAFTKREGALMALGFTVIVILFKIVEFLGEQLWHAVVKH